MEKIDKVFNLNPKNYLFKLEFTYLTGFPMKEVNYKSKFIFGRKETINILNKQKSKNK